MRICHVITSVSRAAAGVSAAVLDLAEAMAKHGGAGRIVALEDKFTKQDLPSLSLPVEICRRGFSPGWSFSFPLKRRIGCQNDVDIIHSHGLWLYPNWAAASVASTCRIPHVISPHGMLAPLALQRSVLKKKLVWHLFQGNALRRAQILHATSTQEAEKFRELGLHNPIAVIPNGINVPEDVQTLKCSQKAKTLLFLSRIDPIKGLLNLVEAWKILQPKGWRAVIAGPDAGGHLAQVRRSVRESNLDHFFDFTGPIYGEQKWDLYRAADLFVLPSHSENFGIVIAEALAVGTPVITTRATPWKELLDHNCGWWVEVGVDPLVEAMGEAMCISDNQRQEMGLNGRKLIRDSYSWDKIASDMKDVYQWVMGGGPTPPCIMTE